MGYGVAATAGTNITVERRLEQIPGLSRTSDSLRASFARDDAQMRSAVYCCSGLVRAVGRTPSPNAPNFYLRRSGPIIMRACCRAQDDPLFLRVRRVLPLLQGLCINAFSTVGCFIYTTSRCLFSGYAALRSKLHFGTRPHGTPLFCIAQYCGQRLGTPQVPNLRRNAMNKSTPCRLPRGTALNPGTGLGQF